MLLCCYKPNGGKMNRITMLICLLLSLGLTLSAQTYLSESFENWTGSGATAAPDGWTQTVTGIETVNWEKSTYTTSWSPLGNGTKPTGAQNLTSVAHLNDYNMHNTNTRRLESPLLDFSSSQGAEVSFYYFFSSGTASLQLQASNDGGATWGFTTAKIAATGSAWKKITYILPVEFNTANCKIGFLKTGTYGSNDDWLDNVVVKSASPEIDLKGNNVLITDGDNTPATADNTDFGNVYISASKDITFTILNSGSATLNLNGISVTGSSSFTIQTQPASSTVVAAGSTTFVVRFNPTSYGLQSAEISIASNDEDENPFNFTIQGNGVIPYPEINLKGNNTSIVDGDTTPSTSDNTDFGRAFISTTREITYTILNSGPAALNLSGTPVVSISSSPDFSVVAQPAQTILPATTGTTSFVVRFAPSATGLQTAEISIINDDQNENPYNFTIQGTGYSAAAVPFIESFDAITFAPLDWTNSQVAGSGTTSIWKRVTSGSMPTTATHSGTGMAQFNSYGYNSGVQAILATPPLNLSAALYDFKFWMYRDASTSADKVEVYVNSSADLTGAQLLGTVNRSTTLAPVVAVNGWYEYTFQYSSVKTQSAKYFILKGISAYGNNIYVDDVSVSPASLTPSFAITPVSYDYGSIALPVTKLQNFVITNTGGGSLDIAEGGIALAGTDAASFSLGEITYPISLSGGSSATIPVNFVPVTAGVKIAVMQITDNTAKALHELSLTGTALDSPPAISYTALDNTVSTAGQTLSEVVISDIDFTGVDFTSGKAPRIYYKKSTEANLFAENTSAANGWKFVETTSTVSPCSFTMDLALLNTPATGGDIIQYFVVAQDIAATPNTSASPTVGFAASAVDLIISAPTTPNSYTIAPAFTGTKTIGAGADYASLNEAFAALNGGVVTGAVTLLLLDQTYAPTALILNPLTGVSAVNTVTLKPAEGVVVTITSAASQAMTINSDYFILDGDNGGEAGRDLTIISSSTGGALLATGQHITLKNINIANTQNSRGYGIAFNQVSYGIINNCLINKTKKAIITTNGCSNLLIQKNILGSDVTAEKLTLCGIEIANTNGFILQQNDIHGILQSGSNNIQGIAVLASSSAGTISRNKIYDIKNSSSSGYGAHGINLSAGNDAQDIAVQNNMLSDIAAYGSAGSDGNIYNGYGIYIANGHYKIYFNSVYLNTNQTTGYTAAINIVGAGSLDLQNNIFINKNTTGSKNWAIRSAVAKELFTAIDYNNYFATQVFGYFGLEITDLVGWKTATGKDLNSQNSLTVFDNTSYSIGELQYQRDPINQAVFDKGITLAGITEDFYGKSRVIECYNGADIGAYELRQSSVLDDMMLPRVTSLYQNYPNPFNPVTTISFELLNSGFARLSVFNIKGETIKTLVNDLRISGRHSVSFDGTGLNSGVYFYKLEADGKCMIKRMIMIK